MLLLTMGDNVAKMRWQENSQTSEVHDLKQINFDVRGSWKTCQFIERSQIKCWRCKEVGRLRCARNSVAIATRNALVQKISMYYENWKLVPKMRIESYEVEELTVAFFLHFLSSLSINIFASRAWYWATIHCRMKWERCKQDQVRQSQGL